MMLLCDGQYIMIPHGRVMVNIHLSQVWYRYDVIMIYYIEKEILLH